MEDTHKKWKDSLKPEQRKRPYGHFDAAIDLDNEKDFEYVTAKLKNIAKHQFLPLVKFVKKDIRYRRDKNNNPKRAKKERPIMYASHIDSHIYSFFAYQWAKNYEDFIWQNNIDSNVLAYRNKKDGQRGKNNINFAQEVFEHIQNTGNCSVVIADISKFFDKLHHKTLKSRIANVFGRELLDDEYKVFKSLTMFRYVINDSNRNKRKKNKNRSTYEKFRSKIAKRVNRDDCSLAKVVYEAGREGIIRENKLPYGIPQGSPLSGLLANIYMSGFDSEFVKMFPDMLYRRYSDDIAVVCDTLNTERVLSWLNSSIEKYSLKINPDKVFIATFENDSGVLRCSDVRDGKCKKLGRQFIDYLGFEFDGCNVRMRGKTLRNAYRKADKKIKKFLSRQTFKNPCKKHDAIKGDKRRGNNAYIKNACSTMINVGCGIISQKNKLFGFIRKKRTVKFNKKR